MIDFNNIKMISSTIGFVVNVSKAVYNSYKFIKYCTDNPKETAKKVRLFFNPNYTKIILQIFIIASFTVLAYFYFLIADFVWLQFKLSMQGFTFKFILFFILITITAKFYYPIFKELFLVNKNQDPPFTVIR